MSADQVPDSVKGLLRSVLLSKEGGVPLNQVQRDYEQFSYKKLLPSEYGFSSIDKLLDSMPDVARITKNKYGEVVVMAVAAKGMYLSVTAAKAQFNEFKHRPMTEAELAAQPWQQQRGQQRGRQRQRGRGPRNGRERIERRDRDIYSHDNTEKDVSVYIYNLPRDCSEGRLCSYLNSYSFQIEWMRVFPKTGKERNEEEELVALLTMKKSVGELMQGEMDGSCLDGNVLNVELSPLTFSKSTATSPANKSTGSHNIVAPITNQSLATGNIGYSAERTPTTDNFGSGMTKLASHGNGGDLVGKSPSARNLFGGFSQASGGISAHDSDYTGSTVGGGKEMGDLPPLEDINSPADAFSHSGNTVPVLPSLKPVENRFQTQNFNRGKSVSSTDSGLGFQTSTEVLELQRNSDEMSLQRDTGAVGQQMSGYGVEGRRMVGRQNFNDSGMCHVPGAAATTATAAAAAATTATAAVAVAGTATAAAAANTYANYSTNPSGRPSNHSEEQNKLTGTEQGSSLTSRGAGYRSRGRGLLGGERGGVAISVPRMSDSSDESLCGNSGDQRQRGSRGRRGRGGAVLPGSNRKSQSSSSTDNEDRVGGTFVKEGVDVYIGRVPLDITNIDLLDLMQQYGCVTVRPSKPGVFFAKFDTVEGALMAVDQLHENRVEDQRLIVDIAERHKGMVADYMRTRFLQEQEENSRWQEGRNQTGHEGRNQTVNEGRNQTVQEGRNQTVQKESRWQEGGNQTGQESRQEGRNQTVWQESGNQTAQKWHHDDKKTAGNSVGKGLPFSDTLGDFTLDKNEKIVISLSKDLTRKVTIESDCESATTPSREMPGGKVAPSRERMTSSDTQTVYGRVEDPATSKPPARGTGLYSGGTHGTDRSGYPQGSSYMSQHDKSLEYRGTSGPQSQNKMPGSGSSVYPSLQTNRSNNQSLQHHSHPSQVGDIAAQASSLSQFRFQPPTVAASPPQGKSPSNDYSFSSPICDIELPSVTYLNSSLQGAEDFDMGSVSARLSNNCDSRELNMIPRSSFTDSFIGKTEDGTMQGKSRTVVNKENNNVVNQATSLPHSTRNFLQSVSPPTVNNHSERVGEVSRTTSEAESSKASFKSLELPRVFGRGVPEMMSAENRIAMFADVCPKSLPLTARDVTDGGDAIAVGVVYVEENDPKYFWAQVNSQCFAESLKEILSLNGTVSEYPVSELIPVAMTTDVRRAMTQYDGEWCRVWIKSTAAEKAVVFFVDFGNTAVLPRSQLYELPARFWAQPPAAIPFHLSSECETFNPRDYLCEFVQLKVLNISKEGIAEVCPLNEAH